MSTPSKKNIDFPKGHLLGFWRKEVDKYRKQNLMPKKKNKHLLSFVSPVYYPVKGFRDIQSTTCEEGREESPEDGVGNVLL